MKIKIVNFGPIKEFEFDLSKKLIVTYGDNNIGKSYAMQVVYLLLKAFQDFPTEEMTSMLLRISKFIDKMQKDKVLEDIKSDDTALNPKINILKEMLNVVMQKFMTSCRNTFGNLDVTLLKKPHIYVEVDEYRLDINMEKETMSYCKGSIKYAWGITYNNDTPSEMIETYTKDDILSAVKREISHVYFLPASRSGIYSGMSAFGTIVAELSKSRSALTSKIELPGISEPISDYFIELSNISNNSMVDTAVDKELKACYDKIEELILGGHVIFDGNKKSLMYVPDDMDIQFSMIEVSSMVSEVSPIVAFLKYIVANRQNVGSESSAVLFIEEPEAHLHPNNQVKLMEIFTELTSAGITLVMSSHSNYVFNKLNNLVLSGKLDYQIYQPIYLEKGAEGSISKPMHIDECGADDENFIDVSEALYNEREQIIQEHNEGAE